MTPDASSLIACHECGLLHRMQELAPGRTARCTRCGAGLYRTRVNGIERSLVLTFAA